MKKNYESVYRMKLSFSVFREAYEDFVSNGGDFTDKGQRDAFIDSISEMADCELADARTPFFAEAMATFDTEPDYTGFTTENLSTINREIEGYIRIWISMLETMGILTE